MGGESGAETATTKSATNADRDTADPETATGGADAGAVVRASGAVPPVARARGPGKDGGGGKSASEIAYGGGVRSLDEEIAAGQRAIELLTVARSTFLPGYRKAVDSLAVGAALELATHVVSMVKSATHARDELRAATKHGAGAAMV